MCIVACFWSNITCCSIIYVFLCSDSFVCLLSWKTQKVTGNLCTDTGDCCICWKLLYALLV